jgi:hypothetical protein
MINADGSKPSRRELPEPDSRHERAACDAAVVANASTNTKSYSRGFARNC